MSKPEARCAQCGAVLSLSARLCPLCGTARPDDIPDEIPAFNYDAEGTAETQTRRPTHYFPRWLYRTGLGTLGFAVLALLLGIFSPLAALAGAGSLTISIVFLWLSGMCALIGSFIIFFAHFGPWPLERS